MDDRAIINFAPPKELRGGTQIQETRKQFEMITKNNPHANLHLDLSGVEYMDTTGFRLIFDFKSSFSKITPPINHIVEMYDFWVGSKKGLSK